MDVTAYPAARIPQALFTLFEDIVRRLLSSQWRGAGADGPSSVGARGKHAVQVSRLPVGVSALPAAQLVALFSSISGWAVSSVERVYREGSPVGSELLVWAVLGPWVQPAGSLHVQAPDGQRGGPGTGHCRYRAVLPQVAPLPGLATLQAVHATVAAARTAAAAAGFGISA